MRPLDERRKRIALWTATGGTMAVIVAMWALVLPMQLAESRGFRSGSTQWGAADSAVKEEKTLQEIIAEQRLLLRKVEGQEAAATEEKGDLLLRIEQATVAKSVTRTE